MGKHGLKTRPFECLTEEEIKWLKDYHNKFNKLEIQETLNIDHDGLMNALARLGLKLSRDGFTKQDKTTAYGVASAYPERIQDCDIDTAKIRRIKNLVKPGLKIGPYVVIRPYSYHCLMLNPRGYKESMSYSDLAVYFKFKSK